ncbi:hypothetical protein BOTBODRAFT_628659 [Botryobasidium botryosum FD-172 SS1]|uniref:Uncharacterized protein n=1 Tax=Botryobasidium botryosum (strain FD-172 SS1) TaxID=930990 RepID=A0A067MT62_BOTB1|nr:hypothetical protein BOTBODRAFT_628659 [Botryobasidium botryosum FD-172 SS1]
MPPGIYWPQSYHFLSREHGHLGPVRCVRRDMRAPPTQDFILREFDKRTPSGRWSYPVVASAITVFSGDAYACLGQDGQRHLLRSSQGQHTLCTDATQRHEKHPAFEASNPAGTEMKMAARVLPACEGSAAADICPDFPGLYPYLAPPLPYVKASARPFARFDSKRCQTPAAGKRKLAGGGGASGLG